MRGRLKLQSSTKLLLLLLFAKPRFGHVQKERGTYLPSSFTKKRPEICKFACCKQRAKPSSKPEEMLAVVGAAARDENSRFFKYYAE